MPVMSSPEKSACEPVASGFSRNRQLRTCRKSETNRRFASHDADHQRDLPFDPGGVDPRRAAMRVRPADRVRPQVHVVRHAVRLHRGAQDAGGGRRRGRAALRLRGGGDHRRRAAAPARGLRPDGRASRPRPDGDARDRRAHQHRPGAARSDQDRGREVPRQRRGDAQLLGQHGAARPARRGQVRPPRSRRLRLREGCRGALRAAVAVPRRCCSRPSTARWRRATSPRGCSRTACAVRLQLQAHKYIWGAEVRGV